jgi:hypothetical protein
MVTENAKWMLIQFNCDPKLIADVWGIDERECWDYIRLVDHALRHEKEQYTFQTEELNEWVHSIPNANNIRIEAIREKLLDAKVNPDKHNIPRLLAEVRILLGSTERATPQEIERAKEYPIENIIELKRNTALCPFHNEKSPSFSVKNNRYKCFGCGVGGDSISLIMHIKNMTFKQAVDYLQQ